MTFNIWKMAILCKKKEKNCDSLFDLDKKDKSENSFKLKLLFDESLNK